MLQVLQNLSNGQTEIVEVPAPAVSAGRLLIQTERTLISAGTEKMLVEFGQAGWIGKAKAQPEKVRQVLDKIKTDGLMPTMEAVFTKLGEPLPLGYCNVGTVLEVGRGITGFQAGDRVASNGPHAGIVSVPRNLCARVPEGVSADDAVFTVLASIGLQGVRLTEPTLGETVVVYGLGLIGIITVQLLRANGCHVIGIDINPARLSVAESLGAETIHGQECPDVPAMVCAMTAGRGADAVIITASAKSSAIISQAANACRKRGRIVLVGVVGLEIKRGDFYEKELSFRVSCSYGPGRYDSVYEQGGLDYPLPYVRWTEQRNFEAILALLDQRQLSFESLISHRFPIERGQEAYALIQSDPSSLAVLLDYPVEQDRSQTVSMKSSVGSATSSDSGGTRPLVAAVIGAGNFTRATLMPAVKGLPVRWKYAVGRSTASEIQYTAKKFGFENATTDLNAILGDSEVNTLFVTTNHDSHARFVCDGLASGKHVFVEKPLAINQEQIASIAEQQRLSAGEWKIAVGFNRRFSPHTEQCRQLLRGRANPLAIQILVNAGEIPADHWVHDPVVGGGRIIGEACHFIDWAQYVAGAPIISVGSFGIDSGADLRGDTLTINLALADGSVANIAYFSNGAKSFPKESIRIFSDNRTLDIDNFRVTSGYGFAGFKRLKTLRQDKGHQAQFRAVHDYFRGGDGTAFRFDEYVNVSLASIAAVQSAKTAATVSIADMRAELG